MGRPSIVERINVHLIYIYYIALQKAGALSTNLVARWRHRAAHFVSTLTAVDNKEVKPQRRKDILRNIVDDVTLQIVKMATKIVLV
jgi:hypothetical protein